MKCVDIITDRCKNAITKLKKMSSKKTKYFLLIFVVALVIISLQFLLNLSYKKNTMIDSASKNISNKSIPSNINKFENINSNNSRTSIRDNNISIILNASGQDSAGGPILFRAIISGIDSGTCNLSLISGSRTLSSNSQINFQGKYYSCAFTIPFNTVGSGNYKYTLLVSNSNLSNQISGEITVK